MTEEDIDLPGYKHHNHLVELIAFRSDYQGAINYIDELLSSTSETHISECINDISMRSSTLLIEACMTGHIPLICKVLSVPGCNLYRVDPYQKPSLFPLEFLLLNGGASKFFELCHAMNWEEIDNEKMKWGSVFMSILRRENHKFTRDKPHYTEEEVMGNQSASGISAISLAAMCSNMEILTSMIFRYSFFCIQKSFTPGALNPMMICASNGCLEGVKFFVEECNRSPNEGTDERYSPLSIACEEGHSHVVQYLLSLNSTKKNFKSDEGENCMVWNMQKGGHLPILKMLLEEPNVDPNQKFGTLMFTPLMNMISKGFDSIFISTMLKSAKVYVNEVSYTHEKHMERYTALHHALYRAKVSSNSPDSLEIIKILISHPHVSQKYGYYDDILHLAIIFKLDPDTFRMMVNCKKFPLNEENRYKETPLMLACMTDACEYVKILLESGDQTIFFNKYKIIGNEAGYLEVLNRSTNFKVITRDQKIKCQLCMIIDLYQEYIDKENKFEVCNCMMNILEISIADGDMKDPWVVECIERVPNFLFEHQNNMDGKIPELLENLMTDRQGVTTQLRIKHGLAKRDAIIIYVYLSMLCDGSMMIRRRSPRNNPHSSAYRFFNMMIRLPQELQGLVCNLSQGINDASMRSSLVDSIIKINRHLFTMKNVKNDKKIK